MSKRKLNEKEHGMQQAWRQLDQCILERLHAPIKEGIYDPTWANTSYNHYKALQAKLSQFIEELDSPYFTNPMQHPIQNMKVYEAMLRWVGRSLQVEGREFFISRPTIDHLLRFAAPKHEDGSMWYLVSQNLYMDESATYFKVMI